jgi:hypothetical protein
MSDKPELNPEERAYLLRLLKEHLEYFRLLAANPKCSDANRAKYRMLETLWQKLVP